MEDPLANEMAVSPTQLVCSSNEQISALKVLEVAFTKIQSLSSLQYCPNLRELSLIETGALQSLAGIESAAHSLEVLRVIGCQLPAIEPCINSLTHLRDLVLSNNAIEKIENLQGCLRLEKLWLFSNQIAVMENLETNSFLSSLSLQDNRVAKVQGLSTCVHLQDLFLSQNPIATFQDLAELAHLPVLRTLTLACMDFQPCPVALVSGYREFVLATITSACFTQLDNELLKPDAKDSAKREFVQAAVRLQESLTGVEEEYREMLVQLDTKNRENEDQLKYIQKMLIEDLHSLSDEVETGKSQMAKEHSRLKAMRAKSEDTLKGDLNVIQAKYSKKLEKAYKEEQERMELNTLAHEEAIRALEFEKNLALALIDVLYDSQGAVIYTDIEPKQPEFKFLEALLHAKEDEGPTYILRKVFQMTSSEDPADLKTASFLFTHIELSKLKSLLIDKRLSGALTLCRDMVRALPPNPLQNVLLMCRVQEGDASGDMHITETDLGGLLVEFIVAVQVTDARWEESMRRVADDRLLTLLNETTVLLSQAVHGDDIDILSQLEQEAFDKYTEHQRRLWGELDPVVLERVQEQDTETKSLLDMIDSLKTQVDTERQTQQKLLQELRSTYVEKSAPPFSLASFLPDQMKTK